MAKKSMASTTPSPLNIEDDPEPDLKTNLETPEEPLPPIPANWLAKRAKEKRYQMGEAEKKFPSN